MLARQSDVEGQRRGLQLASHMVAASLAAGPQPFADRLRAPFPWLEFLSEADRQEFAREVVDVARASAAMARFDRLLETLSAWRATAEAWPPASPPRSSWIGLMSRPTSLTLATREQESGPPSAEEERVPDPVRDPPGGEGLE